MGELTGGRGATITLSADVSSVSAARLFVAKAVPSDDPRLMDLVLLTSELVTNVVLHAQTEVTLTVRTGPPLRVEVTDGAAAAEAFRELFLGPLPAMAPTQISGRGIAICRMR